MRRFILAALAAIAFTVGFHSPADATEISLHDIQIGSLSINVDDSEDEFTVIDSRMDETATAGVFFGLIGATINSAVNNSEDAAKADPLRSTAAEIDLRSLIESAIRERLTARQAIPLSDSPAAATHTLIVKIGEWGLVRRAQHPDTFMRSFLKLDVSIVDARGRVVWRSQREHSIGQLNAELSAFTPEVLRSEMSAVASRAGQQVANTLIYR